MTEKVAKVLETTVRIADVAQINTSYSLGGANIHPMVPWAHASLSTTVGLSVLAERTGVPDRQSHRHTHHVRYIRHDVCSNTPRANDILAHFVARIKQM